MVNVLLVDANRNIREFCKRELERDGYQVTPARGVADAATLATASRPDVVVADGDLPARGLVSFIRELSSHRVPVVLHVSALPAASGASVLLADDCIEKSGDLRELRNAIDKALQQRRSAPPEKPNAVWQRESPVPDRHWDDDRPY